MTMPQCGCRTGCEHRRNPQFPAQRECRAGVRPELVLEFYSDWRTPLTEVKLTAEQRARAGWASWRHLRRSIREDVS